VEPRKEEEEEEEEEEEDMYIVSLNLFCRKQVEILRNFLRLFQRRDQN
jgi:hypothetical protein